MMRALSNLIRRSIDFKGNLTSSDSGWRLCDTMLILCNELPSYYRGADLMLHLAYVDWCPNAVLEAIKCEVPVITTHNGGVPELIQGSGVIIRNDPDYNLEFLDHNSLPKINATLMGEAIDIILYNQKDFVKPRPDLTIEHCGQQYLNFFRKVLGK